MKKPLSLIMFCTIFLLMKAKSDSLSNIKKNIVSVSYAPSFLSGNGAKNVFHGIELNYERLIIKRLSIGLTQGFYTTSAKNVNWLENKNNTINYFAAKRKDFYFNTFITINAIAFYNKFYALKFGIGPTLSYRNTLAIKSIDVNYSYNEQFYDKGVFGGLHINLQNDFTVKQHLLIGVKFQSHFIFPKKNIGDKQIILRPSISFGYRF